MLPEEKAAAEDAPIMREERGQQSAFTRMTILIGLVIVALLLLTVLLAVALTKYAGVFVAHTMRSLMGHSTCTRVM